MIRFTITPVPRRKREASFVVVILPWNEFHLYLQARHRPADRGMVAAYIPHLQRHPIGSLVFWDTALKQGGPAIAVHEIAHAALSWARRTQLLTKLAEARSMYGEYLSRRSPEERICHAMSAMTSQFVKEGYKRGIWP